MATIFVGPNNNIPLVVGGEYELTPGMASSNWVIITKIDLRNVYARGIDDTVADLKLPIWKFDDVMVAYKINGVLYSKDDYLYDILTQDGLYVLDFQ